MSPKQTKISIEEKSWIEWQSIVTAEKDHTNGWTPSRLIELSNNLFSKIVSHILSKNK